MGIAWGIVALLSMVEILVDAEEDDDDDDIVFDVEGILAEDCLGVIICDGALWLAWMKPSPWLYCRRDILHSDLGNLIASKRRFPWLMAVTSETKKVSSLLYLSAMYFIFSSAQLQ